MDELLDIINNEDLVTGRQMRSTVHNLGLQHRGVHVFLFTADGKMLIKNAVQTAPLPHPCLIAPSRSMSKLERVTLKRHSAA